jgi:hypothetical protein
MLLKQYLVVSRFISLHHSFSGKRRVARRKCIKRGLGGKKQNTPTTLSRYVFIAKLLSLL